MPVWSSHGDGVLSRVTEAGKRVFYVRVWYEDREHRVKAGGTEKQATALRGRLLAEIERARIAGEAWIPPGQKKRAARAAEKQRRARDITLAEFVPIFIRDWLEGKPSKDYYEYRAKWIEDRLGDVRLSALTPQMVEQFYRQRRKDRSRGEVISLSTANHDLKVLRIMLARAVQWGYIPSNPAAAVKPERVPEQKVRYLTKEEADALTAACEPWLRPLVEAALHTGMRRGELLALRWADVDLKQRRIVLGGGGTKSKRNRTIPISKTLLATLNKLRALHTDRVFLRPQVEGRGGQKTTKLVAVTVDVLRNSFEEALAAAGITEFRFHDLRHTFASWLVMAGRPLYEVQKLLGHADQKMTQRYAHLSPEYLRSSVAVLDDLYGTTVLGTVSSPDHAAEESGDATTASDVVVAG